MSCHISFRSCGIHYLFFVFYFLVFGGFLSVILGCEGSAFTPSLTGLPAIVARNMMMDSKSESIVLPLVGRNVQTSRAALSASNSEGADFLIYGLEQEKYFDAKMYSGIADVKIPIFVIYSSHREAKSIMKASQLLKSGAGGLVMSLEDLRLFDDESFSQLFNTASAAEKKTESEPRSFNKFKPVDVENDTKGDKRVAGFVKLEDREKQLIEAERSILFECINVIHKAAPQVIILGIW